MSFETDNWPIVKAKWFTKVPRNDPRNVRLIVLHTMEAPEGPQTAENVAKYFTDPRDKNGDPVKASAHVCIDNNSIVQCVYDSDVAYAAPGANHNGIQVEMAGYAKQTIKNWMDEYSVSMLMKTADVVAQYCLKYNIPPVFLTTVDVMNNRKGITGHHQISIVYKKSNHTDPGSNFPWDFFIEAVKIHIRIREVGY